MRQRGNPGFRIPAFLLSCFFSLAFPAQGGQELPPASDPALLESLIRQNMAAAESITSFHMRHFWQETTERNASGGGGNAIDVESEIWRQGNLYRQQLTQRTRPVDGGEEQVEVFEALLVDTYFALYAGTASNIGLYHFENLESLYPPVDRHARAWPRYPVDQFGFDPSAGTLEAIFESTEVHPGCFRWAVTPQLSDGERLYQIQMFQVGNNDGPLEKSRLGMALTLDANRGYRITTFKFYANDGRVMIDGTVHLQKVADRFWFPAAGVMVKERDGRRITFTVEEVSINQAIDPAVFTLDQLYFPKESARMDEFFADSKESKVKAFYQGAWVSADLLPDDRRRALLGPDKTELFQLPGRRKEK